MNRSLHRLLPLALLVSSAAYAQDAPVSQTGQLTCYDAMGDATACAGSGLDGELRAGVALPVPRFTDNGDGTLTDTLTGLQWLADSDCAASVSFDPDGQNDAEMRWADAFDFLTLINGGGASACTSSAYNDWRVPTIVELESLVNAETDDGQALVNGGFLNLSSYGYWSSTTASDFYPGNGMFVDLRGGQVSDTDKLDSGVVLPVRGGSLDGSPVVGAAAPARRTGQVASQASGDDGDLQAGVAWPAPRFQDNGDGTVDDLLTGLQWLKDGNCMQTAYSNLDADGQVTQAVALAFIAGLNDGSYANCAAAHDDWRLPNRRELFSMTDYSFAGGDSAPPAGHPFENVAGGNSYYWSNTVYANLTTWAFRLHMRSATLAGAPRDYDAHVWPVRGGPSAPTGEPNIAVSPASLDFGVVEEGTVSNAQWVRIDNLGDAPLALNGYALGGSDRLQFRIESDAAADRCPDAPTGLAAGASCRLPLTFVPTGTGAREADLNLDSNDPDSPLVTVSLAGTASKVVTLPGNLVLSASVLDFGDVTVGVLSEARTLTLTVEGDDVVTLQALTLPDGSACELELAPAAMPCGSLPKTLQVEESCQVELRCTPPVAGDFEEQLTVTSDDPDMAEQQVALQAVGVPAGDRVPRIAVMPDALEFGAVPLAKTAILPVTIENEGDATLHVRRVVTEDAVGSLAIAYEMPTVDEWTWVVTEAGVLDAEAPCGDSTPTLEPGQACSLWVSYDAAQDRLAYGAVHIDSDDPNQPRVTLDVGGYSEDWPTDSGCCKGSCRVASEEGDPRAIGGLLLAIGLLLFRTRRRARTGRPSA